MWISAGFAAGLLVAPRFTRWFAAVLVALFGADVLQIAYRKAEDALLRADASVAVATFLTSAPIPGF